MYGRLDFFHLLCYMSWIENSPPPLPSPPQVYQISHSTTWSSNPSHLQWVKPWGVLQCFRTCPLWWMHASYNIEAPRVNYTCTTWPTLVQRCISLREEADIIMNYTKLFTWRRFLHTCTRIMLKIHMWALHASHWLWTTPRGFTWYQHFCNVCERNVFCKLCWCFYVPNDEAVLCSLIGIHVQIQ